MFNHLYIPQDKHLQDNFTTLIRYFNDPIPRSNPTKNYSWHLMIWILAVSSVIGFSIVFLFTSFFLNECQLPFFLVLFLELIITVPNTTFLVFFIFKKFMITKIMQYGAIYSAQIIFISSPRRTVLGSKYINIKVQFSTDHKIVTMSVRLFNFDQLIHNPKDIDILYLDMTFKPIVCVADLLHNIN